jgi:hypothetical protein
MYEIGFLSLGTPCVEAISAHTVAAMYSMFSWQCFCEAISFITSSVKLDGWSTMLRTEDALTKISLYYMLPSYIKSL